VSRGVVIDLAARREQRLRDDALRAIRRMRTISVPDKLVDDVLGPDDRHFRLAERLDRATGLEWPRPGAIGRLLAAFVKSERGS